MYVLLCGLIIVFALLILSPLTIAKQICNQFRSKKTHTNPFTFAGFKKASYKDTEAKFLDAGIQDVSTSISIVHDLIERSPDGDNGDESDKHI